MTTGAALTLKPASRGRQVTAAVIGNALEWYDFTIFGAMSSLLSELFFPSDDPQAALLKTLAVFGVGFVMRPVGGILLGIYADRKGRKAALQLIIALMSLAIAMIAFAPTYASIGIGAPILMVTARLLQGFATGGEFASATAFLVESAPAHRRGLYGSWQLFGQCIAVFVGALIGWGITHHLSPEALNSWGWRAPFVLGLLIAPVGMWIRRHMSETEDFVRVSQREKPVPMMQVLREHKRGVWVTMGSAISGTVTFYVMLINMPNFARTELGLPIDQVFMVQSLSVALLTLLVPLAGWLSDVIGRRTVLIVGTLGTGVIASPLIYWVSTFPSIGNLLVMQLLMCVLIALSFGPAPTALAEQFPTKVRSTGIAVAYNIAVMVFGGFAPWMVTKLVGLTGSPVAAGAYVLLAGLIGTAAWLSMREGRGQVLLREQAGAVEQGA